MLVKKKVASEAKSHLQKPKGSDGGGWLTGWYIMPVVCVCVSVEREI